MFSTKNLTFINNVAFTCQIYCTYFINKKTEYFEQFILFTAIKKVFVLLGMIVYALSLNL